jgi:hypothetical protein
MKGAEYEISNCAIFSILLLLLLLQLYTLFLAACSPTPSVCLGLPSYWPSLTFQKEQNMPLPDPFISIPNLCSSHEVRDKILQK